MKIIKPLLIYITWIAFVWLCIAYAYAISSYQTASKKQINCSYTVNVGTYQEGNVFGAVSTGEDCMLISQMIKECGSINCSKSSIKIYVNNISITGYGEYDINTNLEQGIGTEVEQYINPNQGMGLGCKQFVSDSFDYKYGNTAANRGRGYINTAGYVTDFKPALVKLDDNKRYEYRSCWNMRYLYTGNEGIGFPNY